MRLDHFHYGVPKYRLGHNNRVTPTRRRAVPLESVSCQCGCGEMTTPGKQFRSGHNGRGVARPESVRQAVRAAMTGSRNHRYGKHPANFKGEHIESFGYRLLHQPGHPFARKNTNYVPEHRLVVEAHLRATDPTSPHLVAVGDGKYLDPALEVHHINGIKDDNRVENLQVMTKAEHASHHKKKR